MAVDIEKLLSCTSEEERNALIRQIVDTLCRGDQSLSDENTLLIANVVVGLLCKLDVDTRLDLSIRMAQSPNVPVALVDVLARSHIQIARPVLRWSPQLDDERLIALIKSAGGEHSLAIAQRRDVSPELSDALIADVTPETTVALARNPGARFSRKGLRRLSQIAGQAPDVEEALCSRDDLPPEIENKIMKSVKARLHSELGSIAEPLQHDEIRTVMRTTDIQSPTEVTDTIELSQSAYVEIAKLRSKQELNEDKLAEFLAQGKRALAICAFAHLGRIEPAIARRLVLTPFGPSLALVARAAPLKLETYRALVESFAEYTGVSDDEAVEQLCASYEEPTIRDARSIVEVHRRRRSHRATRRSEQVTPEAAVLIRRQEPTAAAQ